MNNKWLGIAIAAAVIVGAAWWIKHNKESQSPTAGLERSLRQAQRETHQLGKEASKTADTMRKESSNVASEMTRQSAP